MINYLTVVQLKRSNSISSEKVEIKERQLFKKKVRNLMNVMRVLSASNRIGPGDIKKEDQEEFQVEVVMASKLSYFM